MKPQHLIVLVILNVFWAGALSIYKELEHYLDTGGIVTLRFGMAAVILLLCWPWLPGKAPRGRDLVITLLMGLIVFSLGHRIQVYGNMLGTAANSSVLMATEPIITSVAAAFILREHIGPRRWAGFAFGMAGVALLNGILEPGFHWGSLFASLVFISSFVCEALYSVIGKPLMLRSSMMKILALALTFGTLANLIADGAHTLPAAIAMPAHLWLLILYLATFCTAIGYAYWSVVIKVCDVNVVAMTIFVQPIAGVAIAAIFLHESLHLSQLWGSIAIVAGLVLGLSRQVKPS